MTADTFDTDPYPTAGSVFSNGNLTVQLFPPPNFAADTVWSMAQLRSGKNTGEWYLEFTCNNDTGTTAKGVGIIWDNGTAGNDAAFNFWGGFSYGPMGVCYRRNGQVWFNGELLPAITLAAWVAGDIIGMKINFTTPDLAFNKNGGAFTSVPLSPLHDGLAVGFNAYPCVGTCDGNPSDPSTWTEFTINTSTSQTYSVPMGFTPGWTNTDAGTYEGTFASNGQGTSRTPGPVSNTLVVSPYKMSYDGVISEVHLPVAGPFTAVAPGKGNYCVIYDNTGPGGTPGTLIARSTSIAYNEVDGALVIATFNPPVPVANASTYYFGFIIDSVGVGTTNAVNMPWNAKSGAAGIGSYYIDVTPPAVPSTFGTPAGSQNFRIPLKMIAAARPPPGPPITVGQVIMSGCVQIQITAGDGGNFTGKIISGVLPTIPDDPDNTPEPISPGDWTLYTPTTTVTGLDYLNEKEVWARVDGLPVGPLTVVDGSVTLPFAGSFIIVGLLYTCDFQTLRIEMEGVPTLQGRRKLLPAVDVIVECSLGLEIGFGNFEGMYPIPDTALPLTVPPPTLRSGVFHVPTGAYWDVEGQICFRQPWPLPATVLGIVFEATIGDDGE